MPAQSLPWTTAAAATGGPRPAPPPTSRRHCTTRRPTTWTTRHQQHPSSAGQESGQGISTKVAKRARIKDRPNLSWTFSVNVIHTDFSGHVSFGSANSSTSAALALGGSAASSYLRRSNRLLAATPYFSKDRQSQRQQRKIKAGNGAANNTTQEEDDQTQPELRQRQMLNSSSLSDATLSTTAKTILDTLERMSTPVRDAQKIPVPRAERRRQIADELISSSGEKIRRRPRLGGGRGNSSLPSSPF